MMQQITIFQWNSAHYEARNKCFLKYISWNLLIVLREEMLRNFRRCCHVLHQFKWKDYNKLREIYFLRRAHLWNILHETCFVNILHATYLQLSAHKGNIFQAICCIPSIWINEKHNNNVRSCATFPHATQLISFTKHTARNKRLLFRSVRYSIEIYWFAAS